MSDAELGLDLKRAARRSGLVSRGGEAGRAHRARSAAPGSSVVERRQPDRLRPPVRIGLQLAESAHIGGSDQPRDLPRARPLAGKVAGDLLEAALFGVAELRDAAGAQGAGVASPDGIVHCGPDLGQQTDRRARRLGLFEANERVDLGADQAPRAERFRLLIDQGAKGGLVAVIAIERRERSLGERGGRPRSRRADQLEVGPDRVGERLDPVLSSSFRRAERPG